MEFQYLVLIMEIVTTFYKFENRIFYWNNYTDTVFSVLPDLRIEPSFIISPGEHRFPRSRYLCLEILMKNKFLNLFKIFETSRFFVIRYYFKRDNTYSYMIKDNQSLF